MHAVSALDALFDATRSCDRCNVLLPPHDGRGRPRSWCRACRPSRYLGDSITPKPKPPRVPKEKASRSVAHTRWCLECLGPLMPGRSRYCSQTCQDALKVRAISRQRARDRGPAVKPLLPTCQNCGFAFKPKHSDRTTYCGRPCAYEHKSKLAQIAREAPKPPPPPKPLRVVEPKTSSAVFFKKCAWCERLFASRTAHRQGCSEKCGNAISYRKRCPLQLTSFACPQCGDVFTPKVNLSSAIFCSQHCSKKHTRIVSNRLRRARKRTPGGERVSPVLVFERDGWKCQMCGVVTPRKLRGTIHMDAPELDHIVPLAAGGEHTYRNTQCLCRECNIAKGDQVIGPMRLCG
jgi:hypothetical protein